MNKRPPLIRERVYTPPSKRYGERWKSLPVEPYESAAFPHREPMKWYDWLVIAGMLIGSACLVYMLARVIWAAL